MRLEANNDGGGHSAAAGAAVPIDDEMHIDPTLWEWARSVAYTDQDPIHRARQRGQHE